MTKEDIERLVESLEGLPPGGALPVGTMGVEEVRAEDIADVLSDVDEATKVLIVSLLSDEKAAEVLVETDENTSQTVLEHMSQQRMVRLLDLMDPDDAADVIELAPDDLQAGVLAGLEEEQQRSVRALHEYPPQSAGGIMTTEVIAAGSQDTVAATLEVVGEAEQPEASTAVFVTDAAGTLVGVVALQDLLGADPQAEVQSVMDPDVISVPLEADQEEAARQVERYNLASLPVVDAAGRLKGVITLDDVIDVLAEEASEDMLRLAGTSVLHPTTEPILRRLRARAPWLAITLAGTFFAGLMLEAIELKWFGGTGTTSYFSALLYFVPLIAGMAGNVGTQSSTIMVRGFATGEVDPTRPLRVLRGELILAVMIGVMAGIVVGAATTLFFSVDGLGLVVGLALPASILTAALAGTLIPFFCHSIKVDPAYAGGPFLLTLNDLAAIAIYFGVALALKDVLAGA